MKKLTNKENEMAILSRSNYSRERWNRLSKKYFYETIHLRQQSKKLVPV